MPCRNPECEQRIMSDDELLARVIEQLLTVTIPDDIADKMGTHISCARCANIKIANWLKELETRRQS